MIIWYRTTKHSIEITECEFARETESYLVRSGGRREAKVSEYERYHWSWEAARTFLLCRENRLREIAAKEERTHAGNIAQLLDLIPHASADSAKEPRS